MTTTATTLVFDHLAEQEQEQVGLVRTFPVELAEGDGRTLETRIAPYNVSAMVSDPPDFRPYQEMFLPGAFERQVNAANHAGRTLGIWLNFEHEQGLRGIIGRGTQLRDETDGLYGTFRMDEGPDADKALRFVNDGELTGLSLEFRAVKGGSRWLGGVRQRLRAHIDRVSLCRFPAYEQAQVLAVRSEAGELPEAAPLSVELAERLGALGVEVLQRIATTAKPWDGSPTRFTDEQYLRACLIVRSGDQPAKERGSLPVLEPDGTLNTNALGAAAAALAGARGGVANVTREQKASAARKLIRYYGQAKMVPPDSLKALGRQ